MIDKKLKIFQMAATLNNFTEAAAALGMTQPNVTRQISLLEQELGTPLFERDGRRVFPTPAGRALLKETERLLADADHLRKTVRCAAEGIRHYRIGGTLTAGGFLLPDGIAAYMESHPDCNLELHVGNTREIEELLNTHRLDVALVEGPFDRNRFFAELFLEEELIPVFAPGACEETFSLKDYLETGHRLILREPGSGTRYYFDRFLEEAELPLPHSDSIVEVNSFDALKLLVRRGLGISVISTLAVADELASGVLNAGRFTEGRIFRQMNFIYTATENLKFAEDFIAFCRRRKHWFPHAVRGLRDRH